MAGLVVILLLGLLVALQTPAVQTGLARYATRKLSGKIDGRLEIGAIRLHPFNAVTVKDAVIIDNSPFSPTVGDTLASVGKLSATFSLKSLFHKKGLYLDRVELEDVLFQLVTEPDSIWKVNLARVFRMRSNPDSKLTTDTLFTINRAEIRNARYRMLDFKHGPGQDKPNLDFTNLDVTVSEASARNVDLYGGQMHFTVDKLAAREKKGYELYHASGSGCVGMGQTLINGLNLRDNHGSDARLQRLEFTYEGSKSWSNFPVEVEIDGSFKPSHLCLSSVGEFAGGALFGNPLSLDIVSGKVDGTIDNLRLSKLKFAQLHGMSGTVDGSIRGLTDIRNSYTDANISEFRFTTSDIQALLADFGAKADLRKFAPGQEFVLDASARGPLNNLDATAALTSAIGSVHAGATVRGLTEGSTSLNASVRTDKLDLGKFLGTDALGKCSMTASASARMGSGGLSCDLHKAEISKLGALGYDYSDISVEGSLHKDRLTASVRSDDPNAVFCLDGDFDFRHKSGQLSGEVTHADLAALNIDKRGSASEVSFGISADQGIDKDDPLRIHISDLALRNDDGQYDLGDIDAGARLAGDQLTMVLNSDMVDAKYNGPSDIASVVNYIKSVSVDESLPDFFNTGESPSKAAPKPSDATLSAVFHDTSGLLAFLLPGAEIAMGTALNLDIDSAGNLLGYVSSPHVEYNGVSARAMNLAIDNMDGNLSCIVNSDELSLGGMTFRKASVSMDAADNHAQLAMNYEGADVLGGGSELYLDATLGRDDKGKPTLDVTTQPSYIRVGDDVWELETNGVNMRDGNFAFDGFHLSNDTQSISIDGGISSAAGDTLRVEMTKMDLAVLGDLLGGLGYKIEGVIDGNATLISPLKTSLGLGADLTVKGLRIDGTPAGDIRLLSSLDESGRNLGVKLSDTVNGRQTLGVNGSIGIKDKSLDATVLLDGFDVGVAKPFVGKILPEIGGKLHGTVKASGSLEHPQFASTGIRLDAVRARVAATNVLYTLNGTMGVESDALKFNSIGVMDEYGGLGTLNGQLGFRDFKDFRLDARLDMHRLKALDANEPGEIGIYGDLAVTGNGRVAGPFDALNIDADIITAGSGNVNVPIPSSANAQGSDLLVFTKPDAGESGDGTATAAGKKKSAGKLTAHAKVTIYPDVIANVEVDKDSGHMLTAGGSGTVIADVNTAKDKVSLKGDYNIDKGKYLFNIPGIVGKEFDIKQGSSLKFNGDIAESTLDISAIHNVKTSLTTIVADTTSVSSRRLVECGINIGGKLTNPEVSFSIDVPDLDPNTRMKVESALDTEDKIQKQFVALMLFGTFLPDERSGVVNGTNMIISNVGEIVSSQLNNILQKLDIPIDFGLGYQQDNVGTDIFDVAVSTQLFNNRVLVNGSVGNRKYSTSKSANGDMVGDLDIEIKMDRSGELRFKLFSHSADEYSSSLDFSQRNGIGLSYQKEFDRFRDFFRQLFMSRSRRALEALEEAERKKTMKTVVVDGTD